MIGPAFDRPPVDVAQMARRRAAGGRLRTPVLIIAAVAAAVLPPALSIAAVLGVAALLLFLSNPMVGIYALFFAVPFESVRNIQAGGINITITEFTVFCVSAAWLGRAGRSVVLFERYLRRNPGRKERMDCDRRLDDREDPGHERRRRYVEGVRHSAGELSQRRRVHGGLSRFPARHRRRRRFGPERSK